jgi:hypothetical protein
MRERSIELAGLDRCVPLFGPVDFPNGPKVAASPE